MKNERKIHGDATWLRVTAATMEYLSFFPTTQLLFELLPLDRWYPPETPGKIAAIIDVLRHLKAPCLPFWVRSLLARLNPDYDVNLSGWPRSAADFPPRRAIRRKTTSYLRQGRWLQAYAFFWKSRRPFTTNKIFLPLLHLLNVHHRPFLATMGAFFWSGFLHACFVPLLLLYLWLAPRDLALVSFLGIWLGFTMLGLPVAFRQAAIKKAKENKFLAQ